MLLYKPPSQLAFKVNATTPNKSVCDNVPPFLGLRATLTRAEVAVLNSQLCIGVPVESRAWPLAIVGFVCVPLALIAVALRCYSRSSVARRLSADDWIIVAAAALLLALVVLDVTGTSAADNRDP